MGNEDRIRSVRKTNGKVRQDLTGVRFGRLTVIELDHMSAQHDSFWLCECDCGNRKVVRGASLKNGNTTSCGCRKRERRSEDLTGKRFGRLYVLGFDHMAGKGHSYWLCECDCGNQTVVERSPLLDGRTVSCGCKSKEGFHSEDLTARHFGNLYVIGVGHISPKSGTYWLCECGCGNNILLRGRELLNGRITSCGCEDGAPMYNADTSYDSLYNIWVGIKQRCGNTSNPAYDRYGGRGIFVCDDWYSFENFRNWALRNGYEQGLTIDRINNDDGYYPENCRWADMIQQANNTRKNHYVTYNDITHTVAEWSRLLQIPYHTLLRHVNNNDMRDFEDYFGG